MPRSATALLVLSLVLVTVSAAGAQIEPDAGDLLRTLREHLVAGRHAEALVTARRCSEVLPGNAAVWYNLAGLEDRAGNRDAAVAALRQAVLVGFDEFRFADRDPDLSDLRADPAYAELRQAWAAGLAARAGERRIELDADTWSPSLEFTDRRGGLDPPTASARLRTTRDHLDVEILAELKPMGAVPPWSGGTGLIVALLLPEDPATGEGRLFAEFGVGMADGIPAGALRLGSRWQSLSELTPKMRRDSDSGRLRVTFAIPWSVCDSLHPLVDAELGLNLTWIRADDGGRAALLADPAAGRSDRSWRRGIPVRTRWDSGMGPAVSVRVPDRVVRDGTIDLDPLVVLTGESVGDAEVDLVLRDRDGTLRLQDTWTVPGAGPTRNRSGVLAVDAPAGSARLGATSGSATWETNLVLLPEGWETDAAARIDLAPGRERPSLQFRLDAVTHALEHRLPRQDPSAIGATVNELESMLGGVETRGTSLPAGGSYLAVAPTGHGNPELLCSLSLPDGWRRGDPARVVLLLVRAPGQEQKAVVMAPRLLAERADGSQVQPLIVAIAHLAPIRATDTAHQAGLHLIDWLREFVSVDMVHLAGVDLLAATAVELATVRPDAVAAALLITGMNFVPYPGLPPGQSPPPWAELPNDLPVSWIWFPDEVGPGDQGAILREVLRARGTILDPAVPVSGGLDFSQAWSRTVVWASESGQ